VTITETGQISSEDTSIVNLIPAADGIVNAGSLTSQSTAIMNASSDPDSVKSLNTISNLASGIIDGGSGVGILNQSGLIKSINNAGNIRAEYAGVFQVSGTINELTNNSTGVIYSTSFGAVSNLANSVLGQLDNFGRISGYAGIYNSESAIFSLNNYESGEIVGGQGILNDGNGNIGSINNSGLIRGELQGGISNNRGSIIGTLANNVSGRVEGVDGVVNAYGGQISTLSNAGQITGTYAGVNNFRDGSGSGLSRIGDLINIAGGSIVGGQYGIVNDQSEISLLSNAGSISATMDGGNAISNSDSSTITTLINNGIISSSGRNTAAIINSDASTITTLTNSRSIAAVNSSSVLSSGIFNSNSTITNLNNSGSIEAIAVSDSFGIVNDFGGTITTLTNRGSISTSSILISFGIGNQGFIRTLNNAQGGNSTSPATTALTYTGNLPDYYNIIINSPAYYGQLVASFVSGSTVFGISSLTTTSRSIINATFASVLTGISATQLGLPGLTSFSGVSGIYSYLLTLTDPILNIWGLTVTACQVCKITIASGETVTLSQLSGEPNLIMAGGTLALSNGDQSNQNFSVETTSTITAPTTGSATLSGVFSGSGGLIFNGVGTTILTGANTYTGGTTVLSGVLQGNTTSLQGAIVNNSQVVFDQATEGTYSGVMSGTGSLVKQNTGTLILTGANTYTGGTTVSSGTLSVSGASPTGFGNVLVSSGATLMGTGTINGQLTVAGILKPGNSPGYLAATNTVTMNAGSIYMQDIAGRAQATSTTPVGATGYYSALNITGGQFVINSGSTLTPRLSNLFTSSESGYGSTPYTPVLGDRFRMVKADGGISGRFSTITQPPELAAGTQFLPFYNMAGSNSVDLSVIPTAYQTTIASASGNSNAKSVGAALTQIAQASMAGTATPAQERLLYSIAGQTTAQGISNFAQSLSGEVYAATVAVLAQTTQRTQQAVLNRLGDTAGLTMTTPMASSSTSTQVGGAPSAAVSSNPSVDPSAEAKAFSKGNVWGELAYQRGSRANDSQSGGWSSNLYQLTFGSDFYSVDGKTAGAGFALSSTTINPVYGSSTIQQGSLFAYGKMPVESFVVDAMASVGLSSSDIKRGDVTGLSTGFRNNAVSGNDVMLSLGVSRPMDLESLRITPFARVTWQMVSQSGVNESGVASALSVNRYTGNGVRGVIGLAAGSKANNPMTAKNTYRAYVGVGADSSGLLNPTLNASLAGIGTNITTPNAGTAFVQAGLYGTAKMSENTFAYAGISGEARSGQTLGTINLGLKLQF
jgi:autotransporter-associated beta strand protein